MSGIAGDSASLSGMSCASSAARSGSLARFEEAQLVCDEMARRARQNIEVIVERLAECGIPLPHQRQRAGSGDPLHPADAAAAELAAWLEERFASVPMTLLSWLRLVGDVWLVGTHPHWAASAAADPLVIQLEGSHYPGEPMQRYFEGELEAWHSWAGADRMFVLPISPDMISQGQRQRRPALRHHPARRRR